MSEQPLHALERFRKRSNRLVLEEHTHHEVAAGCGGVVLRWRNPQRAVALSIYLYSPGKANLFLDGAEVETLGADLAPGAHQLALALEDVDLAGGLFQFAALRQTEDYGSAGPAGLAGSTWRLVSEADRTWLTTLDEPATRDWTGAEFDDTSWFELARSVPNPTPNWRDPGAYQMLWCNEFKAACLALPTGRQGQGRVWVRRRFVVPS